MPPTPRISTALRIGLFLLAGGALFVLAGRMDHWVFNTLPYDAEKGVYSHDWGRMLRVAGFLPTWLFVGLAMMLVDSAGTGGARPGCWRAAIRRGLLVCIAPSVAGLLAEGLKLLIRRQKPIERMFDGVYHFRSWQVPDWWSTSGLGLPSSHATVAFGAAMILSYLFPRARVLWFGLALGCGFTRVLDRAHFTSDVAGAAVVGMAAGWLVWDVAKRIRGPVAK